MAKKKAEIRLYGDIFQWNENSAGMFTSKLEELQRQSDEVTLRMHCYGGDPIEGNVIGNAIEKGGKVTIQIDGIAASMGAFLLPNAARVVMVENGYIMVHAPMLSAHQMTADELEKQIKVIRDMEQKFIAKLQAKTKQPEEVIKGWLVGDNWFTAQEAKELGLVDEIIKAVADVEVIAKSDLKAYTAQSLYSRFSAYLKDEDFTNQLNNNEMNKPEFIARYGLTDVTAESSEADIYASMDRKIKAERTAKETAENNLAAEKEKQITALVDKAEADKKITAQQKVQFVTIGKTAGIEALQVALDAIKEVPSITGMLGGGSGQRTDVTTRVDWNWNKWQEKDPRGLEVMAKTNPETFKALHKAEYGFEPEV